MTREELLQYIMNQGIENVRFMVPMRPVTDYGFVKLTSSSDEPVVVECRIDESQYKVEDGYKVTLKAIDERFGYDHFYVLDLVSLIQRGYIKIKGGDEQWAW
jgi:hypothetical protein